MELGDEPDLDPDAAVESDEEPDAADEPDEPEESLLEPADDDEPFLRSERSASAVEPKLPAERLSVL